MESKVYPTSEVRTNSKRAPELHFDRDWFHSHIANHGIRVRIEKTVVCPNFIGNVDSLQHDVNCTLCENGFYHYDPIECMVLFQQDALVKAFLREGVFDPGQAIVTLPAFTEDGTKEILIHYFDRVTLLDEEERFYQLINKSEGDMDVLRYNAIKTLMVIDRRGIIYTEGVHFNLDTNGNIVWVAGKDRPRWNAEEGIGESFSVSYTFRPVYRVLDMLHEGRFSQRLVNGGVQMIRHPQSVLIKKDYYMSKKDLDGMPFKAPIPAQEFLYNHKETPIDY